MTRPYERTPLETLKKLARDYQRELQSRGMAAHDLDFAMAQLALVKAELKERGEEEPPQ